MPARDSTARFDIGREVVGNAVVVAVTGDIDLGTAPSFASEIDSALTPTPAALIVDLTGVGFLGSSAMTVLAAAHDRMGELTTITVVADGTATRRPLELLGLGSVMAIHSTREDALAAVEAG
ncbi:anti-sigma factor antagonist [Rhodococcus sp. RS1C4]|uniref:STAS domain-containing protein n=1 Tax=Nocardiaceae TaxID=85025 RepID=UPI000368A231|nr:MULTISPECIES: STAS domain-containing protein [Rhodococcus]OZC55620.1 anti-sigma factor antagonist [Rhodococcus sp. 06-621-2]OZC57665.1 anti-sigma factor antagonist [Rhodococcus sp. RS1C4]OZC92940.1 anti-sigma factor antagonist [Rhodococcus sp. 06-418-1B]OZD08747.1 anti-sigma factor antagonist [Rhodococcus sp. 06-156-4C]OZD17325.1 anti-sigma factor antagonist [Rhodococcus sp. 06-156-3C]